MALLHHLTMGDILTRILAALIFAALAGFATAGFLWLWGDRTAFYEKRVALNPFTHVSLSGIFLAIAFRTSWFSPLPYDRKKRSLAPLLAVFSAMAVMVGMIPLLDLMRSPLHALLPTTIGYSVLFEIETLQKLILNSLVLGLLPLPGLWLGNVIPAVFPILEKHYRKKAAFGLSAAAILMILGSFPDLTRLLDMLRLV